MGAESIIPCVPSHRSVSACPRTADLFSQSGKETERRGEKLVGNPAAFFFPSSFGHFQGRYSPVTTFGIEGRQKSPSDLFIITSRLRSCVVKICDMKLILPAQANRVGSIFTNTGSLNPKSDVPHPRRQEGIIWRAGGRPVTRILPSFVRCQFSLTHLVISQDKLPSPLFLISGLPYDCDDVML